MKTKKKKNLKKHYFTKNFKNIQLETGDIMKNEMYGVIKIMFGEKNKNVEWKK